MNFEGPLIGLATFLIIGVFHPIVIKTEYYFGTRPWWIFLLLCLCNYLHEHVEDWAHPKSLDVLMTVFS